MLAGTDRKREILSVSQRLFKEKGFTSTTVRDIAKALRMEPASLYSHVKTKEDILNQICFGMAEKFQLAIDEVNDIYFDAEGKLRMMVDNHVKILTDDLNAATVFVKKPL
jgi:AcrR family transcriptional regulator